MSTVERTALADFPMKIKKRICLSKDPNRSFTLCFAIRYLWRSHFGFCYDTIRLQAPVAQVDRARDS